MTNTSEPPSSTGKNSQIFRNIMVWCDAIVTAREKVACFTAVGRSKSLLGVIVVAVQLINSS